MVARIDTLLQETYALWDRVRVGFSWRHYYLNHTYRIRDLSCGMAEAEGADPELLTVAALLHDITKRYDGEILKTPEGKNVLDEEGFWRNEMLAPDRSNWVTTLYDELELSGMIHHTSGAIITERVLQEYGYAGAYRETVAEVVRGHLKPEGLGEAEMARRYRLPESRVLYDADTIDPNVGLTAFYRNIQINAGFWLRRGETPDLEAYAGSLSRWVNSKDSFIDKLLTERGRQVAAERQSRNRALCAQLEAEIEEAAVNRQYGILGCVAYLMTDAEDPSLHRHARGLRETWLPSREAALADENGYERDRATESLGRARGFIANLEAEIAGLG